jgi:hypothetical protein
MRPTRGSGFGIKRFILADLDPTKVDVLPQHSLRFIFTTSVSLSDMEIIAN